MKNYIITENGDFSFEAIKNAFKDYAMDNGAFGEKLIIEKEKGIYIDDDVLKTKVQMGYAWVTAVVYGHYRAGNDMTNSKNIITKKIVKTAFSKESEKVYNYCMVGMEYQLEQEGDIDPIILTSLVGDLCEDNPYATNIVKTLFENQYYSTLTDHWARLAFPKAKEATRKVLTYNDTLLNGDKNDIYTRVFK